MGYRVNYGPMNRAPRRNYRRASSWALLCGACFLCFLVVVWGFWEEGRLVLQKLLFPGDWAAVEEGVAAFRDAANSGASAAACAEAFCREILNVYIG